MEAFILPPCPPYPSQYAAATETWSLNTRGLENFALWL